MRPSFVLTFLSPQCNSATRHHWRRLSPGRRLCQRTAKEVIQTKNLQMVKAHYQACPQKYGTRDISEPLMKYYDEQVYEHLFLHGLLLVNQHLADCAALYGRGKVVKRLYRQFEIECSPDIAQIMTRRGHTELQREMYDLYRFPLPYKDSGPYRGSSSAAVMQLTATGSRSKHGNPIQQQQKQQQRQRSSRSFSFCGR